MAAQLSDAETDVELKRGGFGELRVEVDGRDVYDGNRLAYSTPGRIVNRVREELRGMDAR